jgi:hypothetical protein
MSTPLDQVCNQLRAKIETIGDDLVHVAAGHGTFSNPQAVYLTLSLAIGALETITYEMRRHGLLGGPP